MKRLDGKRHWVRTVACVFLLSGLWQAGPTWAQDPTRGELRIEGTHISKILLEGRDDSHREELSDPCSSVSLPVGAYRIQQMELKGGYIYRGGSLPASDRVTIMEGGSEVLKVGGPLRQEIVADRRGRTLVLRYGLVGIGGESYTRVTRDRPPRFTVLKGDKAVVSGQFEYG